MNYRTAFGLLAVALSVGVAGAMAVGAQEQTGKAAKAATQAEVAPGQATIGKPFKNFTLTDIASEEKKKVSLESFKGKKPVIGIFMANRCGTTWTYESKIGNLIKDSSKKGYQVVIIHSNYQEPNSEILGQIEQRNLAAPVLDDKADQALANYVQARVTPTFFIVDKGGVLRYIGAFDDHGTAPSYVPDALDAVLAGKVPAQSQTRAFG